MTGTFASFLKTLTLQARSVLIIAVSGQNPVDVELNGNLVNSVLMRGALLFGRVNGSETCPMELRRIAGKTVMFPDGEGSYIQCASLDQLQ